MEGLSAKDVVTAVLLLALGIAMVITSIMVNFRYRHQFLSSLGGFFYVSFALVAGLCVLLAASHIVRSGRFDLAAAYIAIAFALYLLGLGLRRLMVGH